MIFLESIGSRASLSAESLRQQATKNGQALQINDLWGFFFVGGVGCESQQNAKNGQSSIANS